jgi:hypothetical protein
MIQTMNATAVRQDFFDILMAAKEKKQITKIKLNGLVVARIVPEEEKKFDWGKYIKEQEKVSKIIKKADWSDLKEIRKSFDFKK